MDWSPIWISMKTATLSIIITFFLGVWMARLVVSARSEKVKMVLDGILTLPMVLPPTVAGFFLLMIFGVKRPLGQLFLELFGVKIVFSWAATVIAAVAISFPLMYRAARGAFEQVDVTLIYAARTLGFSESRIFWKVILPSAMPGVLSGAILAFARGLGEFGGQYRRKDADTAACHLFTGGGWKNVDGIPICVDHRGDFLPGCRADECAVAAGYARTQQS